MKKLSIMFLSSMFLIAGCGNDEDTADTEDTHIVVASQTPPMTDIVEVAAEAVEEPYTIELMEVADNIQFNEAVFNDEADASFAQHELYMEQFNRENGADLVATEEIYNAIVGFYSPVYESVEEVQEGDEVAIPSDPTNATRALLMLADQDLIKLDEEAGLEATVEDVVENPYELEFTQVEVLNLKESYEDGVPLVFSYPAYIEPLGLTPDDAVFLEEDSDNTYASQVVVREGQLDSDKIQALNKAFTSPEVYEFLKELEDKAHLDPAFEPGQPAE
ncbi:MULTISPECIES: MetQ/NlpA family ABC transporter substrate-binding protein [Jeotgalicoccus]|uniref:MetQ/NlpA family ABC transporter substrate-binding protein n=1 Tax=Jeotgalicoccus TaxID=227979 RepID=UPI0004154D57|nr:MULTISPECIES: MetQ/NlpA family ABC transporter substrate-binding protein [Jeotgalicoccus]